MNFDKAFELVIGHEGGYSNNPKDPGGETKYGISKRAYPDVDIRSLTLDRAKAIYRRDYWDALGLDDLPDLIRFDVFDVAVNSGLVRAVKILQAAVDVTVDGKLGPKTRAAVAAMDPLRLRLAFAALRLLFYTDLSTFSTFGKGWVRRVANNLLLED